MHKGEEILIWTLDTSCLCPSLSTPSYNHTQQKREQCTMPQNDGAQLYIYLHLLTVLHGTVNGVASTTNDITLGPTPQQSFDGLRASQTAGHVERRLPSIVQLIYPRAQPRTHDLSEDRMEWWTLNGWKWNRDFSPVEPHLDDDRRILFGSKVHGRLAIAVFEVSPSLAFLQQLLHARRVATLTRQVQRRLTWCIPSIDLTGDRKMAWSRWSFTWSGQKNKYICRGLLSSRQPLFSNTHMETNLHTWTSSVSHH